MKRMMSIAAIALLMAGSTAFACSGCGCTAEKDKAKTECKEGESKKECDSKKAEKKGCSSCSSKKSA